jgi:hypothetical protein
MLNEKALKETLLDLLKIMKAQTEVYVILTAELTATKEALRALNQDFDDTLTKKRQQAGQNILPSVSGLIDQIHLLSRRLTAGEVC